MILEDSPADGKSTWRVLLVEDEFLIAMGLKRDLTEQGCEVVGVARNCAEALRLADLHRPDVALMDYKLQDEIDGATVARELLRLGIKVVFLTGNLEAALRDTADLPCSYFAKPLSQQDLGRVLAGLASEG